MEHISQTLQAMGSNQVGLKKTAKSMYTSKEVLELGIPHRTQPPEPKPCKFCGKILYYEGLIMLGSIFMWSPSPKRCTCEKSVNYWKKYDAEEKKKKTDEELAEKNRKKGERIQRLICNSGIKKRFVSRTFDGFKITKENKKAFETAKKYAENFPLYAEAGRGIYFEGTCGTGKTHLAVAIAMKLIANGIPVICKTSIDILADIKKSYDDNSHYGEYQILDVYKNIDLLIIDDLGKEQCTEWSMPIIYTVLNDRYEELRPTIITTNYNEEMLIKRLTPKFGDSSNIEAIISRLHECNDVVTMAWNDYRGGDASG